AGRPGRLANRCRTEPGKKGGRAAQHAAPRVMNETMGERTVRTAADNATFGPPSDETDGGLPPLAATIRSLSDRLVQAQRPLRVLGALRWDAEVERAFFASG